jgi:hypothetical protein
LKRKKKRERKGEQEGKKIESIMDSTAGSKRHI